MNKAISSNQLAYSVSAFILASNLLTSNVYSFVKNDSWFAVIAGFAVSLLIIGIYILLSRSYPGLGLFEINDAVFGKIVGKIMSFFYIFYFVSLAILNTRVMGDFVKGEELTRTPLMLIFVVFILVCAWAVRKGPVNMTRYGFFSTFVAIVVITTITLLLIYKYNLKHLAPSFMLPARNYVIGTHIVTMLPFCEILAFTTFIPHLYRPNQFGRAMLKGLTIAAVMLLIVVLRDTVVLGKFITIFSMPSYYTARCIDIGDILTRVEIVYAIVLIGLLFFKVSITYYATIAGLTKILGTSMYQSLIYIIGALICIYAAACFPSLAGHVKWKMTAAPTFSTVFILILPLLTLIVSFIRNSLSPKKHASESA